jgi:hypothetical protein
MSQVRPDLVLQIFFPKFEHNFVEAAFSRVEVCDVFASRLPLGKSLTPTLGKYADAKRTAATALLNRN